MRALKENERLVEAGLIGLRGPDGKFMKGEQFYKIITIGPGEECEALSKGEKAVCDAIVHDAVELFGQYVRAAKKLDRRATA